MPLAAETMRILLAAAEAITGMCPLQGHYESYYQYQAARSPFYSGEYTAFAETVQSAAFRIARQEFAAIPMPGRRSLLNAVRTTSYGRRFEDIFFQETLAIFLRTDAWLQLGYPSWEGSPRGLHSYRRSV